MTTHEMLKEICDKIGYKINQDKHWWYEDKKRYDRSYGDATVDEREIIFTQEFMDKFMQYYFRDDNDESIDIYIKNNLFQNLDNPTEYLYNLIK